MFRLRMLGASWEPQEMQSMDKLRFIAVTQTSSIFQDGMSSVALRRAHRLGCALIAAGFLACIASGAQNQGATPMPSSDLGRENLNRVAASAGELKTVLVKDPGLMVELKRWVAKDATDHGQIVGDSDLTNDAIFGRLEADPQFRSVATILVQRYGYLTPKVNPDSELGKERELLIQERTKWLAQSQEEELAAARQRNSKNLQNTRSCDPLLDGNCNSPQTNPPTNRGQEQQQPGVEIPFQRNF